MWECEWWSLIKTDASVQSHLRQNFLYKGSLSEERLTKKITDGKLFGYVQCDSKVPQLLRRYFSNFPPTVKNTIVSKKDLGTLMKDYAEKENFMFQARGKPISSFRLTNGTLIIPLLLFYLQVGLVCKKIIGSFNTFSKSVSTPSSFIRYAVNARVKVDENPTLSVFAETLKPLANNSYGYQILFRSWHLVTKYFNDEKRTVQ